MTAVRRLPERRVRPGQRPGSSLSPVASTAHTVGAAKPNLCRAAPRGRCPVAPPRPEPTRAVPAAPRRPGPGAAALLVRGRFSRRGLRLGVRLRPRLLVAAVVVLGELGHLGQHRTWRGAGGRCDRGGPSRSGRGEPLARRARLLLRLLSSNPTVGVAGSGRRFGSACGQLGQAARCGAGSGLWLGSGCARRGVPPGSAAGGRSGRGWIVGAPGQLDGL